MTSQRATPAPAAAAAGMAAVALGIEGKGHGPNVRAARIALGGVATVRWRAREAEVILAGKPLDEAAATRAADAAFAGANTHEHNAYKVPLGEATLVRALLAAGTGGLTMADYTSPVPAPGKNMGRPDPRVEGRAKVTGGLVYGSDTPVANPAHAYLLTSAIAKGSVRKFDLVAAKALPGVIETFTHENTPKLRHVMPLFMGGFSSTKHLPLGSADVVHEGQIIGVVVAETYEVARDANAAVANAVYHATGKRIRDLPITIDKLIA